MYNKNKNISLLKMYFCPPNLKTWLRAWAMALGKWQAKLALLRLISCYERSI